MSPTLRAQVGVLARRSIIRTLRQPASIVPSILFPLILLAVNSGGLARATDIRGFPSESFLDFALGFAFMQGAVFATTNSGTDLARDIQTGFLNRLALTPVRGAALLAGQLAGVALQALVQAVVYLVVGLAFGASVQAGVAGALVLLVLSFLVSVAFAAIGAFLALRSGSGEAVQRCSAALRGALPLLDEHAAQPDRGRLVPLDRDGQPGLVPDRGPAQPGHPRVGLAGARARLRVRGARARRRDRRLGVALRQRLVRT
ncbi:MAG: ABC transporter permease [Thermoleophilia bacterium]